MVFLLCQWGPEVGIPTKAGCISRLPISWHPHFQPLLVLVLGEALTWGGVPMPCHYCNALRAQLWRECQDAIWLSFLLGQVSPSRITHKPVSTLAGNVQQQSTCRYTGDEHCLVFHLYFLALGVFVTVSLIGV